MAGEIDPMVALARDTVEEYVRSRRVKELSVPIPPELEERAGAFVCLMSGIQRLGAVRTSIVAATEDGSVAPCDPACCFSSR